MWERFILQIKEVMHIIKTVDVIMRFRLSVDSSLVNF